MNYRIEDFEKDPNWKPSYGEKLDKTHFRNGHNHAECDPNTGICTVHYDKHDPYESLVEFFNHMKDSNKGKAVLVIGAGLLLDQIFTGGQIRDTLLKSLFG